MTNRTITREEWLADAVKRFGDDPLEWKFVCPSCGHVAAVKDWKDAGAPEGAVAFSCVGRYTGAGDTKSFRLAGGPCNYAGGGLFKLNPVTVIDEEGQEHGMFDFEHDEVRP